MADKKENIVQTMRGAKISANPIRMVDTEKGINPAMENVSIKIACNDVVNTYLLSDSQFITTLGSDPNSCDICIDDPTLKPRQFAIIRMPKEFVLINCCYETSCTFDGILVNQLICPPSRRCVVTMGQTLLIFNEETSNPLKEEKHYHYQAQPRVNPFDGGVTILSHGTRNTTKEPILIGSDERCDFVIEGLHPYHMLIHWHKAGVYLFPFSDNINVNGQELDEAVLLEDEDQIVTDGHVFDISFHGDVANRAFTMYSEKDVYFSHYMFKALGDSVCDTFTVPIEEAQYIMGRHPNAGIRLNDEGISREHAVLTVGNNYMHVQDNGSANGISVNDNATLESYLYLGDTLEIGRNVFLLIYT